MIGLVWPASSDKIMVSKVPKLPVVPVSFMTEGIKELEAHLPQDYKQSIKVPEHYFVDSFPMLEQPVKILKIWPGSFFFAINEKYPLVLTSV